VPSLRDVFETLADGQLLAVDVKTPWAVMPLVSEVRRRRLESRVLIWCTSAWACRYAAHRLPAVEVAYLKTALDPESQRKFLDTAVATGARAVSTHWRAVSAEHVAEAHKRGLRIFSWHNGFDLDAEKLRAGLDILITDFPHQAQKAYARL
jgi:glycerophosphoryl diester phosphodiesterase